MVTEHGANRINSKILFLVCPPANQNSSLPSAAQNRLRVNWNCFPILTGVYCKLFGKMGY